MLKFQKKDSTDFQWSTLGGESKGDEEAQDAFQRIIKELLGLELKTKNIYPVYDYFNEEKGKDSFVFYAEVKSPKEFKCLEEGTYSWVAFDEISKLPYAPHSKQDIIVGERVINAKWREDEANRQTVITSQI